MKENKRKYTKCGCSPSEEPNICLYRFPKPGCNNMLRCELWTKFCFPQEACSSPEFQNKLHNQHRMLCSRHFKETSFIDFSKKKLHRFAVPFDENESANVLSMEPIAGPSHAPDVFVDMTDTAPSVNIPKYTTQVQAVLDNQKEREKNEFANVLTMEPIAGPSHAPDVFVDITHTAPPINIPKGSTHVQAVPYRQRESAKDIPALVEAKHSMKPKAGQEILKTEREIFLYNKCRKDMKRICNLRNQIKKFKNKAVLNNILENNSVQALMKKLTPTFALLLQAQIKKFKRTARGRRWTKEEKITALRLFKRSPTCYHLLRRLFYLPAPRFYFPLAVGVHTRVLNVLKKSLNSQIPSDNEYIIMFDEMSIRKNLLYNSKIDIIEGFQDHGAQGR